MATATKTQSDQFAAAQQEVAEAAQNQFLASVKAQQKVMLDAATLWAEQAGKLYPKVPANVAADVREQSKKNEALYDELVAAHREFAAKWLEIIAPVAD